MDPLVMKNPYMSMFYYTQINFASNTFKILANFLPNTKSNIQNY